MEQARLHATPRVRGPVLGVGAIVLRSRRGRLEVLMVRRLSEPFRGLWSFPGGHVEPGEAILEAAARELREETGVDAEPLGIVHVHELLANGPAGPTHYVIMDVLMRYLGGEPRPGSDAGEAAFIPLESLDSLEMTPGARAVAARLPELARGCLLRPARTDSLP